MAWSALLEKNLRRRALAAAEALAHVLARAPAAGPFGAACDRSLGEGDAGVAVFLAYVGGRRAASILERAVDGAASARMGASLHAGFTGVAWALDHLADRLPVAEGATGGVEPLLRASLWRDRGLDTPGLAFGRAGVALWCLEGSPVRAGLGRAVVASLRRTAVRDATGACWPTRASGFLGQRFPRGFCDLSLAAGQAGIVLALAQLVSARVGGPSARALLIDAARWLAARCPPGSRPPAYVAVTDRAGKSLATGGPPMPAGPSWLKGALGLAVAIEAAGRTLGDAELRARATELARRVAATPPAGCDDATLGHGAAGIAHGLARLFAGTGDARLADGARRWGARSLELVHLVGRAPVRRGILLGAAGVGLVLASAAHNIDPTWDRMFGGF